MIKEFNVESKAEYLALSSTCSQKKDTKTNKSQGPLNTVQVKIREGSPINVVAVYLFLCL